MEPKPVRKQLQKLRREFRFVQANATFVSLIHNPNDFIKAPPEESPVLLAEEMLKLLLAHQTHAVGRQPCREHVAF